MKIEKDNCLSLSLSVRAKLACSSVHRVTISVCFGGTLGAVLVPVRVGMLTLHPEKFESRNKHAQEFLIREQFSPRPLAY
jgi:hypothetical protein